MDIGSKWDYTQINALFSAVPISVLWTGRNNRRAFKWLLIWSTWGERNSYSSPSTVKKVKTLIIKHTQMWLSDRATKGWKAVWKQDLFWHTFLHSVIALNLQLPLMPTILTSDHSANASAINLLFQQLTCWISRQQSTYTPLLCIIVSHFVSEEDHIPAVILPHFVWSHDWIKQQTVSQIDLVSKMGLSWAGGST